MIEIRVNNLCDICLFGKLPCNLHLDHSDAMEVAKRNVSLLLLMNIINPRRARTKPTISSVQWLSNEKQREWTAELADTRMFNLHGEHDRSASGHGYVPRVLRFLPVSLYLDWACWCLFNLYSQSQANNKWEKTIYFVGAIMGQTKWVCSWNDDRMISGATNRELIGLCAELAESARERKVGQPPMNLTIWALCSCEL